MTHTPTPWKVFTTLDGRKLVGIGSEEGDGILDCGFGVWSWNDAEGIANAKLIVKAVNAHDALVEYIQSSASAGCATAKYLLERHDLVGLVGRAHHE